ncbi:MAG: hypothetical protein MK132_07200 [Lentisphaerales bacterium]|nr:hypothetical protein [Lentisphaerales bacterium]
MKTLKIFLCAFQLLYSLAAVEYNDYENYKIIDKDQDFNVETSELRKWSESYARIWAYNQTMAKDAFPAGAHLLRKVDGDNDREISARELRDFQEKLKPVFKKAYERFKENFDVNNNGRIEKSEISEAFIKHPGYFHYFNQNSNYILEPFGEVFGEKPEQGRRPPKRKADKKLDDLYD